MAAAPKAPAKAAKGTQTVSVGASIIRAIAARPAPAEMPIMPGSAKGLRSTPWRMQPDKARLAPAKAAQMPRGMRRV